MATDGQIETAKRWLTTLAILLATLARAGAAEPTSEQLEFFEKIIRPLLTEHCYGCHSTKAKELQGGLLLDSKAGWEKGGTGGPVIMPGEPGKSRFIQALKSADSQGPPEHRHLTARQIIDLERWVTIGAPDPRTEPLAPAAETKRTLDFSSARKFWSYQPITDPPLPQVKQPGWPQMPVDRFILARLE